MIGPIAIQVIAILIVCAGSMIWEATLLDGFAARYWIFDIILYTLTFQ